MSNLTTNLCSIAFCKDLKHQYNDLRFMIHYENQIQISQLYLIVIIYANHYCLPTHDHNKLTYQSLLVIQIFSLKLTGLTAFPIHFDDKMKKFVPSMMISS